MALAGQPVSGLDAAPLRRRTAARGRAVVDVKPGDAVIGVTQGLVKPSWKGLAVATMVGLGDPAKSGLELAQHLHGFTSVLSQLHHTSLERFS
jgi:hypothetical protein